MLHRVDNKVLDLVRARVSNCKFFMTDCNKVDWSCKALQHRSHVTERSCHDLT